MLLVKTRDSLLTSSSGYTNYRGILNLVIILLVLSNARAALENVIKYGILVDPLSWFQFFGQGQKHRPALLIALALGAHALASLAIERFIAQTCRYRSTISSKGQKKTNGEEPEEGDTSVMRFAQTAIVLNLCGCLALPPLVLYTHDTHPISASASLMLVSIVFLKLVSYHMMNFWCRDLRRPSARQARTTRSFLRSYTPPALEFGAVSLDDEESSDGPDVAGGHNEEDSKTTTGTGKESPTSDLDVTPPPNGDKQQSPARRRARNPKTSNDDQCQSPSGPQPHKDRLRKLALEATSHRYPDNLTLADLGRYLCFPTLVYELDFARTSRIRKRFLIKRTIELLILSHLDMALIQQWIVPTVSNSMLPLRQMQFSHMLERLLKLAIPNHVIWLIWFYLFFHSLLNIQAELTRFADREFYRDWWNSESVNYFWSNWNLPVHKWCARHLYVPLLALGLTKCQASTAVFFVSAFFHEYLVSVPLKMFRMWAFTGMLIQLPWARFVSSYFNSHLANVAVWCSLIIGQPLCILMYYHDYYVINNTVCK